MNKKLTSVLALALCLIMAVGTLSSCQPVTPATFKQAQYNTYTATLPSNWNEFTYADNNDTQIMSYIGILKKESHYEQVCYPRSSLRH